MKVFLEEGTYNRQGILGYLKLDVYRYYLQQCFPFLFVISVKIGSSCFDLYIS